jgi:DNA modification methylase
MTHMHIIYGDALAEMRRMPDNHVDIVVTSPPYNMGLTPGGNGRGTYKHTTQKAARFAEGYGAHDDAMPQDEYDEWQRACLAEMWRVSRVAVFYNHRPRVEHGVLRPPLSMDYGIPLRQIIVWDRGTGIDVNLRHFCTRQEWVLLFAHSNFQLANHSASGMGDVWRLGIARDSSHIAPFPLSLPARCIAATDAASVLDPFMGHGTTLRAAADVGIDAIGIDNDPACCEAARRRLDQLSLFGGQQ